VFFASLNIPENILKNESFLSSNTSLILVNSSTVLKCIFSKSKYLSFSLIKLNISFSFILALSITDSVYPTKIYKDL
jgi:hypothetical protein